MSRGPGRRQRALLEQLRQGPTRAVPVGCPDSEASVWRRAARQLCRAEPPRARAIYRREQDARGAWRPVLYLTVPESTEQGDAYPLRSPRYVAAPTDGAGFLLSLGQELIRAALQGQGLRVPRRVVRQVTRELLQQRLSG